MKKLSNYILLLCALIIFNACAEEEQKVKDTKVTEIIDSAKITEENTEVPLEKMASYPIPTPYETTQLLQEAGAAYVFDLTNPATNANKYILEKQRAINLGIYGADLGYAGTYKKSKEVKAYFKVLKKLSEELEINTIYTQEFGEDLEANLENPEKLHKIVTSTYHGTFMFLNSNEKSSTAVLILVGGWIETMYLSTQLAIVATDNSKIKENIIKQKKAYSILSGLLKIHSSKEEIKEIYTQMQPVGKILVNIKEATPTAEQLKTLVKAIEKLRNSVTMN